jgi:hypothetical protein
MSTPLVLFGPSGEQFNQYTTQRWPFGTQLVMQDGRKYRFGYAPTLLVVGDLLTSAANVANHVNLTAVASALGTGTPSVTTGATAATANQYAEGFAVVSVTPDGGRVYKIDNHLANAGSAALVLNLAAGDTIKAAWTTTSRVDLIKNPYDGVIQAPVTTITGAPVGAACSAIAAGAYGWVQTAGIAAILTQGTLVLGNPAAYIQVAARVGPPAAVTDGVVGFVQRVAAAAAWSSIRLTIDS